MSEHSPGPWSWVEVLVADAEGHHLQDAAGEPILTGGADHGGGWRNGVVSVDEESMDARLIAAAPDLLAALRQALEAFDGMVISGGGVEEWRALIRRIEGGE